MHNGFLGFFLSKSTISSILVFNYLRHTSTFKELRSTLCKYYFQSKVFFIVKDLSMICDKNRVRGNTHPPTYIHTYIHWSLNILYSVPVDVLKLDFQLKTYTFYLTRTLVQFSRKRRSFLQLNLSFKSFSNVHNAM